jgi:bacterioferritin-associated ferredoxin
MKPDDHICCCHKVPLMKLWHFARRLRPERPSQMSECLGAGTSCGWCIPFLKKIQERALASPPHCSAPEPHDADFAEPADLADMSPEEYARLRRQYLDGGQDRNTF